LSRRIGQNGSVEVRNGAYRGRWLEDVPGQTERVKRSVVLGFTKDLTKSEARRKLRQIISETGINAPTYVIPSTESFSKRAAAWEETYLSRRKPSTRRTMKYHLTKYLLPKWGGTPVDCITPEKVNEWLGELPSHLSPTSLKRIITTLAMALGRTFGKKVTYPSQTKAEEEPRCFTPEEMAAIVAESGGMYKMLFETATETGMRSGELFALMVPDLDFGRNIIHVRRSAWEGSTQSPKSKNAYRAIDVQPSLMWNLKNYLGGRTAGLVFPSENGTPLRESNVLRRHLHPVLKKLGLPLGGMHGFRHGRVSYLVEQGVPTELIKRWIGHGSEQMIRRYTHLRPEYGSKWLRQIAPVIGAKVASLPLCPTNHDTKMAVSY
jgi:integrase